METHPKDVHEQFVMSMPGHLRERLERRAKASGNALAAEVRRILAENLPP
jgi:hypothetical protein